MEFDDQYILANLGEVFPDKINLYKSCRTLDVSEARLSPDSGIELETKSKTAVVVVCDGLAADSTECKKQAYSLASKLLQIHPEIDPEMDLFSCYLPFKEEKLTLHYCSYQCMMESRCAIYLNQIMQNYEKVYFIAVSLGCCLLSGALQFLYESNRIQTQPVIFFIAPGFKLQFPYMKHEMIEFTEEESEIARFKLLSF